MEWISLRKCSIIFWKTSDKSYFNLNLSFLRAQKVLKFEFVVEVTIVFAKNIKKASSGMFALFISYINCHNFLKICNF